METDPISVTFKSLIPLFPVLLPRAATPSEVAAN